jgi:hypothetical protein
MMYVPISWLVFSSRHAPTVVSQYRDKTHQHSRVVCEQCCPLRSRLLRTSTGVVRPRTEMQSVMMASGSNNLGRLRRDYAVAIGE